MRTQDLLNVWDAPDNSKLTPKQISIRLPILVAAKISALCDLYPTKSKTEIIGDLLAMALIDLEKGMSPIKGDFITQLYDEHTKQKTNVFDDVGLRKKFLKQTSVHLRALEKEAKVKEPMPFSTESVTYEEETEPW